MGEEQTGVTLEETREAEFEERVEALEKEEEKLARKDGPTPEQDVSSLRTEIEDIRDDLGHYISELDRRRHDAFDLRHQLHEHRDLLLAAGVVLAAAAGTLLGWKLAPPRRKTLPSRLAGSLEGGLRSAGASGELASALVKGAIGVAAAGAAAAVKALVDRRMAAKNPL